MSQYQHIMIVTDPAMRRSTAFIRGVELARKTGARLTLLLVDYSPTLYRARFLDAAVLNKAIEGYMAVRERWLEKEAKLLRVEGIKVDTRAIWHKPVYEEIARQAMQGKPDLVIKDNEKTNGVARAVFAPADWQLMRLCPSPLMLVNAHASTHPQSILAAVDPFDSHDKPSSLNDDVVNAALAMAYQCDATVDVVHAYQYIPTAVPAGTETIFVDSAVFEQIRTEHQRAFAEFGKRHGIPDERMHLLEGSPAVAISKLATEINADLAVLGTVQRRALKRVFIGSTAEEILGSIDCDVLVLKPQDFTAALDAELAASNDQ